MRILVTGTSGQLGSDVATELLRRGHEVFGADRARAGFSPRMDCSRANVGEGGFKHVMLDITDAKAVARTIMEARPEAIIHCAAWTDVDGAEEPENLAKVRAVNVEGTRNLAEAVKKVDAKFLYISTDYVFDGTGTEPWEPDEKNYAPVNVYGQSKLDGEKEVVRVLKKFFVVRIAWVFGRHGKNFAKTMIEVGRKHEVVRVVDDQVGTPTYTIDLARLLADMIETEKYGYYHATNEGGYVSWADFAEEIYRQAGLKTKVERVTTEEYGASSARRPLNSRLDKAKLKEEGFKLLPDWKDAVRRFLEEMKDEK